MDQLGEDDTIHGVIATTVLEDDKINVPFFDLGALKMRDCIIKNYYTNLEVESFGVNVEESIGMTFGIGETVSRTPINVK